MKEFQVRNYIGRPNPVEYEMFLNDWAEQGWEYIGTSARNWHQDGAWTTIYYDVFSKELSDE